MGNSTYAVFFLIGSRWGLNLQESDRKDGNHMQEPYKEMYMHLYTHMVILENIFQKLTMIIGNSMTDSTDILLADLNEQVNDRADIEKHFADLFKS